MKKIYLNNLIAISFVIFSINLLLLFSKNSILSLRASLLSSMLGLKSASLFLFENIWIGKSLVIFVLSSRNGFSGLLRDSTLEILVLKNR